MKKLMFAAMTASLAGVSFGGLIDTITDSSASTTNVVSNVALGADEYGAGNSQKVLGSGRTGFGGTVGNGALYMDVDSSNLFVGFAPGANLNDVAVLFIDSRAGGFTDADMNDTGDGGRNAITNLTRDSNDVFHPNFLPDFAVIFGNFGVVGFELTAGNTPNHLIFKDYFSQTGGNTNFREVGLSRSTYAIGNTFNFMMLYTSDSGFMSNESMPGQPGLGNDNIGFGTTGTNVDLSNYNQFNAVPEPGTMAALGLGAIALIRRRRAK